MRIITAGYKLVDPQTKQALADSIKDKICKQLHIEATDCIWVDTTPMEQTLATGHCGRHYKSIQAMAEGNPLLRTYKKIMPIIKNHVEKDIDSVVNIVLIDEFGTHASVSMCCILENTLRADKVKVIHSHNVHEAYWGVRRGLRAMQH